MLKKRTRIHLNIELKSSSNLLEDVIITDQKAEKKVLVE